ncbi:hypothetical protein ABPG72_005726 [Tetrahymena utriculariae]
MISKKGIILFIFIIKSLQSDLQNCLQQNIFQIDNHVCLECQQGYFLDVTSNNCLPNKCQAFLYFDVDNQECKSICSNNQVMNKKSQECQDQNFCPKFIEAGKQFNSGSVDQFFLNNYTDDKYQTQSDIITISQYDKNILIWDANTGNMKTQFSGHTQPIIVSNFSQKLQLLVTATQTGEIIIWNYSQSSIQNKIQWQAQMGEYINEQSLISIENSIIVMFGFFGEFYTINYITLKINSFIAHTNVVQKVILINYLNAISYGDDGLIILWNIIDQQNYVILKSDNRCSPLKLDYIQKIYQDGNSILSIMFFGNLEEVEQVTYVEFIQIEQQFPILNCSRVAKIESYQINFLFNIVSFQIEENSQNIIVYSQKNINGLSFNVITKRWEQVFSFQLENLNINNYLISQLHISQSTIFLFDQNGNLFAVKHLINQQSQYIILPFDKYVNLQFNLKRQGINGIKVSENNKNLYIYGDQVTCINLKTNKIKFIITNFLSSQIKQNQQIKSIKFSLKLQLITTAGDNGLIFLYNYLDGKFLEYLIHPNYSLLQIKYQQLIAIQLQIIQDESICASYNDNSVVCFLYNQKNIYQVFQVSSKIVGIVGDDILNNLIIFTDDQASVYNLSLGQLISQVVCQGCFYQHRFIAQKTWLTSYTSIGSTYVWSYPQLTQLFYADNSKYNPTGSLIGQQSGVNDTSINFTHYQNGLLIIRYYNLTYYKSFQYESKINLCALQYPQLIWCATQIGTLVGFGIYYNIIKERKLYIFPILYGQFTEEQDLAFITIDYGSFGTSLQVASLVTHLADQAFNTPDHIIDYIIDEKFQRVYVGEDSGNVQAFTYIKKTNQVYLNIENSVVSKIIPIEDQYKLVIVSRCIKIKDYFTMNIYRENYDHVAQIQDAIIDKNLDFILSFSQDQTQNLHYWFYNQNKSGFLIGHTCAVTNVVFDKNANSILSSDASGVLIIWNYLTLQVTQKVDNLYKSVSIRQLAIVQNANNQIITLGGNYSFIFNFNTKKILSKIFVSQNSAFKIDDLQNNLYIYDISIKVYNYFTGIKISELSGFDDKIKNLLIYQDYIIGYAKLNILSFNRVTLQNIYVGKSTIEVYQGLIIKNLFIFISQTKSSNIKLWDYTTGTMLADMENNYYPENIKYIFQDTDAEVIIAINSNNQVFIYNPFTNAISKITQYLLLGSPPQSDLNNLVIDQQNNLIFIYSTQDLEIWYYYTYLGLQGQRMIIPNDPQIIYIYNSSIDLITFFDKEQNIWSFQNNQLQYLEYLEEQARFAILRQGVIIIGLSNSIIIYNENFNQQVQLNITVIQCFNDERVPYIFFFDDFFKLYQIQINSDYSISSIQTYMILNTMRILETFYNFDFQHLILSDINGQLTILDYQHNKILCQLNDHKKPIRQVQFNTNTNILQLALFSQTPIQMIRSYEMNDYLLISASIVNSIINLKGINQQNIFNYTMVEDYTNNDSSCVEQIKNPYSQFSFQRSILLLQNSLQNSKLKIDNFQLVILIQEDTSFYIQNKDDFIQSGLKNVQIKYYCTDQSLYNKKNSFQMFTQPSDYNLDTLQIQNCNLNLTNNYRYQFHQNLQNFTFNQISLNQNQLKNITLQFYGINVFIIDDMSLIQSNFLYQAKDAKASNNQSNVLYEIQYGSFLYINKLEIINCTIQNTILFRIIGFYQIIIQNLTLQNIQMEGNDIQVYLFDIINSQNLYIRNVYIFNITCNTPIAIFNIGGNYYNRIRNITFRNSQNCSLFQYQKQFSFNTYDQIIKNDIFFLEEILISFIQSTIPIMLVQSDYFQASNLQVFNVTCLSCYGSALSLLNSSFQIDSSKFMNNIGFFGGSIYSLGSLKYFLINNTSISYNQAQSGGAIYLEQSDLIMINCNITYNTANIGGGIRYLKLIPKIIQNLNVNNIMLNRAYIFGNDIASYPRNVLIRKSNQEDNFQIEKQGNEYLISNFRSGDYLGLIVQLIDEEGNIFQISNKLQDISYQVLSEISKYCLELIPNNQTQIAGQSYIAMDSYDQKLSGFQINQTILLAEPDNKFYLILRSNDIKIPNKQKNGFDSTSFSLKIQVTFRNCEIGEIYIPKNQVQNPYCKPCPKGQYSLKVSNKSTEFMNCINCPSQALSCQGKEIKIKNGYWREDNMTDFIIECDNNRFSCMAEDPNSIFYCKRGYIGPLCETCDSAGEVWDEVFVSLSQNKTCVSFNQIHEIRLYVAQYLFILIGVILYINYAIYNTIQNAKKNMYAYYLRIMDIASFRQGESGDLSNVYIKLIMHFYYISSIVQKALKINIPFDFISQSVSTPIQSFQITKFTFNYIKKKEEKFSIYNYQIFLVTIPLQFILISLPDILDNLISIIECRQIGFTKYISLDLLQKCYNQIHLRFIFLFTFPMTLLWSIVFPDKLVTKPQDVTLQSSPLLINNQHVLSQNSMIISPPFQSNKIRSILSNNFNAFSIIKSEDSPSKYKTQSLDTSCQPSIIKPLRLDNVSTIIGQSQDLHNLEQSENIGQNFMRYINDQQASKLMASFFKFSSEKSADVESQKSSSPSIIQNDSCFPQLSLKERLLGFGMCFILGTLISFLSFLPGKSLYATATLYSIGNVISITGTAFLVGFQRQLKNMKDKTRLVTTLVFLSSLTMTFVSVFVFKMKILVLIFVVIQFLSYFWYTLSYIPFGRVILAKCFESCIKS